LPDLACEDVGGTVIAANDEFFAAKENLLRPHEAVFKPEAYTDRGKWMDGWETRRRRQPGCGPGHPSHDGAEPAEGRDWCVVRLGLPGTIHAIIVDTAHFRGNYPEACSIEATELDDPLDLNALDNAQWTTLVPRTPLSGDSQNVFASADRNRYTHVRLSIYPDGGVARLRVLGEVIPDWPRLGSLGGPIDLAALEWGAVVEACSDSFFNSRNNLIKPNRSRSMADGWETRRRRGPGNDWVLVRLAASGTIDELVIDTSHFVGNAPGRCLVEGVQAPGVTVADLSGTELGWRTLLETPLQPHTNHVFANALRRIGPITHLKLSVYPDGGLARLRARGYLAIDEAAARTRGLAALANMPHDAERAALLKCCGSTAWAEQMLAVRPFEDLAALLRAAERVWWSLDEAAYREAFAAHPKIGASKPPPQANDTEAWSVGEQAAAAGADKTTAAELARLNREYEAKHGFIFIVCATGRSAESMLDDLRTRVENSREAELRTAAEEQIKITRIRLHKLIDELAP
jgi:allantoicase